MKALQEQFIGKWESVALETRPNAWGGHYYLRRYFHNTATQANGTLVFYTDESAAELNLTLSVIGPYAFGQASAAVEGATETDFSFTQIVVTPHTQAMADILNQGRAADSLLDVWVPGQTQVVDARIREGVMGMVIGEYREYDLVQVKVDQLYYGARPADGSAPDSPEKRAKSLQVPLKRVDAFSVNQLHGA